MIKDARSAKKLSREIKGYDKEKHRDVAINIMKSAISLKFEQNRELQQKLLDTNGNIVECNPYDKFWSCGLSLHDPNIMESTCWLGKNILGEILESVRDSF